MVKFIFAISNFAGSIVRVATFLFVLACYCMAFPVFCLLEVIGLVFVVTIMSFFIEQEKIKGQLDGGLVSFSGAILLEDIWYWLKRTPGKRQGKSFASFFENSAWPKGAPLVVPVASIFLALIAYIWMINDGLESISFYAIFTIIAVIMVVLVEGNRFDKKD